MLEQAGIAAALMAHSDHTWGTWIAWALLQRAEVEEGLVSLEARRWETWNGEEYRIVGRYRLSFALRSCLLSLELDWSKRLVIRFGCILVVLEPECSFASLEKPAVAVVENQRRAEIPVVVFAQEKERMPLVEQICRP